MSPILVRPVREQLEHDRVIRLLQAKYKRKFEVAINPGNEQAVGVGPGPSQWYPDLVLQSSDRNHKLAGVVEVETAESVNNLEAMSQWAAFGRLRVPFHLYLPTSSVDSARRYCTDLGIPVAELWAYQAVGDQLRFTLVQKSGAAVDARASEPAEPRRKAPVRPVAAQPRSPEPAATKRRANGQVTPRPAGSRAAAARAGASRPSASRPAARRPIAKPSKSAAPRRPAPAKAAPRRKAAKSAARAQKRR